MAATNAATPVSAPVNQDYDPLAPLAPSQTKETPAPKATSKAHAKQPAAHHTAPVEAEAQPQSPSTPSRPASAQKAASSVDHYSYDEKNFGEDPINAAAPESENRLAPPPSRGETCAARYNPGSDRETRRQFFKCLAPCLSLAELEHVLNLTDDQPKDGQTWPHAEEVDRIAQNAVCRAPGASVATPVPARPSVPAESPSRSEHRSIFSVGTRYVAQTGKDARQIAQGEVAVRVAETFAVYGEAHKTLERDFAKWGYGGGIEASTAPYAGGSVSGVIRMGLRQDPSGASAFPLSVGFRVQKSHLWADALIGFVLPTGDKKNDNGGAASVGFGGDI